MLEPAMSFIPQRLPFVLVDRLIDAGETRTRTSFRVPADHVLVADGKLREPGLIEAIAQTAAAGTGYLYQLAGKPVPLGYIGTVQNLEITALPSVGEEIFLETRLENEVMNVKLIHGTVKAGGREIASCDMKIFISKPS